MLRKWYFAFNDRGVAQFERCIKVAVATARRHTRLEAICLYDGEDVPLLGWLQANGVKVVRHRSTLREAIDATPDTSNWKKVVATGAVLRLDIPLLEQDEAFVLYTDCDVMFTQHPAMAEAPEFFACAPEHDPENWSYCNTGAMIINVENMRREHAAISRFAAPRLSEIRQLGRGTYDQGILNAHFEGRWSRLPLTLNWKPYWGYNPDAAIVHFHGPKPKFLEAIVAGKADTVPPVYKVLYDKSPEGCDRYLELFQNEEKKLVPVVALS